MATATLEQPKKPKMKFRLLGGSYTQHTDEQKAQIAELTERLEDAYAKNEVRTINRLEQEIRSIRPVQYFSMKRAEGYCRRNGMKFDPAAYRGDIVESEEDLAKSHNLRDELGISQKSQTCDLQGVHMDFRKFERVGEYEDRGLTWERKPDESASEYAARLQEVANQARLQAEAEASAQAAAVSIVPGLGEAVKSAGAVKPANPQPQAQASPASAQAPQLDKMSEKELRDLAAAEEINVEKCRSRDDVLRQIKAAGQRK